MHVLIIGGTGLISTEITRSLLERGHRVTHFNRGRSSDEFKDLVGLIQGDRKDRAAFESQMRKAGPFDCAIDMIGYAPEDAASSIRALRGRVGHFVFCSTVDVYAKPASRYPYTEAESHQGLSQYAVRKVECERLFREAHDEKAFPVTVIRPAHTYADRGSIIHALDRQTSWLDRVRRGRPVIIHGDGTSLWAAARAEDVGPAFAAAACNSKTFGTSYHVTAEESPTWGQYYEAVAQALGAPLPELVHIPAVDIFRIAGERGRRVFENFQYCNVFDNSAAKTDLDYEYTIPLAEGVRRTVAWLDANGRIQPWQEDPEYDAVIRKWNEGEA